MNRRVGTRWGRCGARTILRIGALAVVAAVSALVAPAEASAQFQPLPSGHEYCASSDPTGRYPASDPWSRLTVGVQPAGAGYVDAQMFSMPPGADCIRGFGTGEPTVSGNPDRCPPKCDLEVQTVCETHCGQHKHAPPFHWTVRLGAAAQPGSSAPYFLGWRGACQPVKDVAPSACIVPMGGDRSTTAYFGAAPDGVAPSAPTATARPIGAYNVEVRWTGASDEWLAGYDVLLNGQVRSRLPTSEARVNVTAFCQTTYSVQVVAFDYSGNRTGSAPAEVRTGRCDAAAAPRPRTVIHLKPRRVTRSRTAFFHFGYVGEIRPRRYQCKLDGRRWARCSGALGKRYRNLARGRHTFRVRAGNAAGYDRTPAVWRWRIR